MASTVSAAPTAQIPLVDYLVLDDEPYLVALECTTCCARFFGRRNACANCFNLEFKTVPISRDGEVRAFTIVHFASPGITVPFVAAVINCSGTTVSGNLINVAPDPQEIKLGMKVRLATYTVGSDQKGTTAIGFGFEPDSPSSDDVREDRDL